MVTTRPPALEPDGKATARRKVKRHQLSGFGTPISLRSRRRSWYGCIGTTCCSAGPGLRPFSKDTHQGRRPRRPTSYPHVEALQDLNVPLPIDDHSWPRTPTPDNVRAATGKQKATPPDYGGCVRPSGGDPHTTWQRRLLPPSAVGPLSRYCPNISAYRAAATLWASWSAVTGSCSALRTLSST